MKHTVGHAASIQLDASIASWRIIDCNTFIKYKCYVMEISIGHWGWTVSPLPWPTGQLASSPSWPRSQPGKKFIFSKNHIFGWMVGALLEFHGFLTDFLSCPKVCLFLYDDISKPQGSPIVFLGVCSFRSMGESDVNLLWWLTGGVSLEICTKLDGTWLEKSSRPRVWA